jgi:hypothetical protein
MTREPPQAGSDKWQSIIIAGSMPARGRAPPPTRPSCGWHPLPTAQGTQACNEGAPAGQTGRGTSAVTSAPGTDHAHSGRWQSAIGCLNRWSGTGSYRKPG